MVHASSMSKLKKRKKKERKKKKKKKRKFESSQPEWCISSIIYSADTPFWSETLEMYPSLRQL